MDGISLEVLLSSEPCTDPDRIPQGELQDPARTDATGRYRARIISLDPFTAACADVTANRLQDPAWTTVERAFPTSLVVGSMRGDPLDSARFDVVVERRSAR